MANGANVLVLDEPTNHLDLPAIEQLEQALDTFAGTVPARHPRPRRCSTTSASPDARVPRLDGSGDRATVTPCR